MVRGVGRYYKDFAQFLSEHFEGKVQKLTVDGGFTCPNRDGTVGYGGCTYCNNASFSPGYCRDGESVSAQLERGKAFFGRKYPKMRYLAYFQSYTGTHGDVDELMGLYEEALGVEGIEGLIVGTRPDCMPDVLLERLAELGRRQFVMIEYGAESSHDATLRMVNRCHTWADTVDALERTHSVGLKTGVHLINGLPGENEEDIMETIESLNLTPVDVAKFHQLQIVRGTKLCGQVERGEVKVREFSVEEYVELCYRIVGKLRKDIAIERFVSQSPAELLVKPRWGLKNYEFMNLLERRLHL